MADVYRLPSRWMVYVEADATFMIQELCSVALCARSVLGDFDTCELNSRLCLIELISGISAQQVLGCGTEVQGVEGGESSCVKLVSRQWVSSEPGGEGWKISDSNHTAQRKIRTEKTQCNITITNLLLLYICIRHIRYTVFIVVLVIVITIIIYLSTNNQLVFNP